MLQALYLVVLDLWHFAFGAKSPVSTGSLLPTIKTPPLLTTQTSPLTVAAPRTKMALPNPPLTELLSSTVGTQALPLGVSTADLTTVRAGIMDQVTYFIVAVPGSQLLLSPHLNYDNAVTRLTYGERILVQGFSGAYAQVTTKHGDGYVHKDALTPNYYEVWPNYSSGSVYEATSPATLATRRLLGDEFLAGQLAWPLQGGEYILVRLRRDHHTIVWPNIRPRTAGLWHQILRGVAGCKSGVLPLTDTIMEWYGDDGEGHLAYVEAVLPDHTLRVSGVGLAVAGEYSELTFSPTTWREWRPVFISVTT